MEPVHYCWSNGRHIHATGQGMTTHILRRALLSIAIAACDMSALPAPAHAADGVTRWSEFAIRSNEDGD